MSRPLNERMVETAQKYLWLSFLSLLMGWGLSVIFSGIFSGVGEIFHTLLYCALFSLYFAAFDGIKNQKIRILMLAVPVLLDGALFFFHRGVIFSAVEGGKAIFLQFGGVAGTGLLYAGKIRLSAAFLFSLISYALVREEQFAFAGTMVLLLLSLAMGWTDQSRLLPYAFPVAAALVLLLASGYRRKLKILPAALVIVLLAALILPKEGTVHPDLQNAAREIKNTAEDYFFFTKERDAFSLHKEGYQPLGDRLGGPVQPQDRPVLQVKGPANSVLYLRASTYNAYTGLNWYDTLSARRYLLYSSAYEKIKKEVLDLDRPMGEEAALYQADVRFLRDDTTTLFVPERQREIQMLGSRMVPYFNTAGEIYITRNVQAGDGYRVSYLPFSIHDAYTRELIEKTKNRHDPYYESVKENYLVVPAHIQKEVWEIAQKITENTEDPFEKALKIREFLMANYRYETNVQVPPSSVDFTAYFLLGEKEGYCTYFATAQTILCRMAGIPARYVTGYTAKTDENGDAQVTSKEAHAWTEIYLNGFGWLTLDATPGDQQQVPKGGENGGASSQPSPSPEPTKTPEPSNPPDSRPDDNENEETPAPTPNPEGNPPEPPKNPENPSDRSKSQGNSFPWWIFLMILLLLILLTVWYLMEEPTRKAARHPRKAGDIYFTNILLLLSCMGLKKRPEETLLEYAQRLNKSSMKEGVVLPDSELFSAASARIYGRAYRIDDQAAKEMYLNLRNSAGKFVRFKAGCLRLIPKRKRK